MPRAHAKVNLWLNVVGRRADGYHLLDSLVAFADLADTLEVSPADALTVEIDGPQAGSLGREADNLVLKAARELARFGRTPRGAAFHLTKNIPMAAGLGGGSADAAAALRALVALWDLAVSEKDLQAIGGALGADVPMCVASRPAIARGVGEELHSVPALPSCGVLLVNPNVSLPTAEVFSARQGPFSVVRPVGKAWTDLADLVAALAERGNDLTGPAVSLRPVIGQVLASLKQSNGVRYAAMSGSGATCFALYESRAAAERAGAQLPAAWWRHAGVFV